MQAWEEKIMEREEGRLIGAREGRKEIIKKLQEKFSVEEIAHLLEISEEEVRQSSEQ